MTAYARLRDPMFCGASERKIPGKIHGRNGENVIFVYKDTPYFHGIQDHISNKKQRFTRPRGLRNVLQTSADKAPVGVNEHIA
jgi:hypothetical protein